MPDEAVKTQLEVVSEKLAAKDAEERIKERAATTSQPQATGQMAPPQKTVLEQLMEEVNNTDNNMRLAVKAGIIRQDAAKVLFREIVSRVVDSSYQELRRQQEADRIFRESQERQARREAEKAQFERPQ
jgi:hypothetical protein